MITKSDLQKIYQWGLKTKFPLKLAPTTKGYTKSTHIHTFKNDVGKIFKQFKNNTLI